jgi:predicted nucleic acid-binding protein
LTRVVDSSAWIEWLADGALANRLNQDIPEPSRCIIPTIVQFELWKWLARELSEESADGFVAFTNECVVIELDTRIALWAAALSAQYKLPTADAVIYATARHFEAELLTCDAHFEGLPGVLYLPKKPN